MIVIQLPEILVVVAADSVDGEAAAAKAAVAVEVKADQYFWPLYRIDLFR